MYQLYYQPEGIWVGDIMPYGKEGQFYVYHQRDTRNPGPFGEPFGWALATSQVLSAARLLNKNVLTIPNSVKNSKCGRLHLQGED